MGLHHARTLARARVPVQGQQIAEHPGALLEPSVERLGLEHRGTFGVSGGDGFGH